MYEFQSDFWWILYHENVPNIKLFIDDWKTALMCVCECFVFNDLVFHCLGKFSLSTAKKNVNNLNLMVFAFNPLSKNFSFSLLPHCDAEWKKGLKIILITRWFLAGF